jgi:hypothetical protein
MWELGDDYTQNPGSLMAPDILRDAAQAIKDRASRHGDSYLTHQRIADLWSAYTGRCLSPADVVRMMILLKVARSQEGNEADPDHATDMAGYAALLQQLAGSR